MTFVKGLGHLFEKHYLISSFLFAGYCRNGTFDKGIYAFLRMSKIGIDVAPYALRTMLDSLVGSQCMDGVVNILDEVCGQSRKMLTQGFNLMSLLL